VRLDQRQGGVGDGGAGHTAKVQGDRGNGKLDGPGVGGTLVVVVVVMVMVMVCCLLLFGAVAM